MTVYIFVVESANEEILEQIFEDREVVNVNSDDPKYVENLSLDSLDDLFDGIREVFDQEVLVTFVDSQYQNKTPYSEKGRQELARITKLRESDEDVKFCNCDWFEFLPHFTVIEPEHSYIFLSSKEFENCYDFANMLQVNLSSNCYFAWGIKDLKEGIDAKAYYNLFCNTKRINQKNSKGEPVTVDIKAIEWMVEHGVRQVEGMVMAGFLKHEAFVQMNVPHWTLNVHSYYSDAIIREFNLLPQPPPGEESKYLKGKTPQEQFNEDAQYRYTILNYMMTSLCKYGLEFGKINSIGGNIHTVNYNFLLK